MNSGTLTWKQTGFINETLILTGYIMLKPLYVFGSGGMQLCDLFLAVGVLWILIKNKFVISFPQSCSKWLKWFFAFTIFVFVVNLAWFGYYLTYYRSVRTAFILSTLYYIYNFIAVLLTIYLMEKLGKDAVIRAVMNGCFFSVLVTFLGILLHTDSQFRNTGFFNNPNQLGFYSIILLTFVCFFGEYIEKYKKWIIISVSVYAVVMSLSKASFFSLFVLLFLYIISQKNQTRKQLIWKISMLVVIGTGLYLFIFGNLSFVTNNYVLRSLRYRIRNVARENDSSLGAGRGYYRIFEMGKHLIWGMGEGAYDRFSVMKGYETHSTYASILVSYGLIGLVLSMVVVLKPLLKQKESFRNLCYMSGIAVYCITHNGIRNTLVWIILSLLLFLKSQSSPMSSELEAAYGKANLSNDKG